MSKLGVYVASYCQPVFLRHCLLQILHQSRRPNVIAVHENVNAKSYIWAVEDVLKSFARARVKVLYHHTPHKLPMPEFFIQPLQALLDEGCDLMVKADVDDLFYREHLQRLTAMMIQARPENDYVMNANSELLVLSNQGGYRYNPSIDFGIWNPTGAHPNSIIFNANVAKEFVYQMSVPRGYNDDVILATYVLPKFKGHKVHAAPTACFVAHGKNVSVAKWSDIPPIEVL